MAVEVGNTLSPDVNEPNRVLDPTPDYRLIQLAVLPTFDPQVDGAVWNNDGTPAVSAG